jgi:hypothetical protein
MLKTIARRIEENEKNEIENDSSSSFSSEELLKYSVEEIIDMLLVIFGRMFKAVNVRDEMEHGEYFITRVYVVQREKNKRFEEYFPLLEEGYSKYLNELKNNFLF